MSGNRTSIIYYTDNCLPEAFARFVQERLVVAAEGKPIISVSQKPIWFGDLSICMGEIGRSHLSMYKQMLAGGEAAGTEFIALAEHDCLYTPEHFNWIPPEKDTFYYNVNHWYVQGSGRRFGEYSYQRRRVLSMLIASRDIFVKACKEKVWMLENGWMLRKGVAGACEPGVIPPEDTMIKVPQEFLMRKDLEQHEIDMIRSLPVEPGVLDRRKLYLDALNEFKDLGKEIGRWKAEAFRTALPNLDIRHERNFSGGRRTRETTMDLPPWGRFEDVMNRNCYA